MSVLDAHVTLAVARTLSRVITLFLAIGFKEVLLVSVLFGTRETLNGAVVGIERARSIISIVARRSYAILAVSEVYGNVY